MSCSPAIRSETQPGSCALPNISLVKFGNAGVAAVTIAISDFAASGGLAIKTETKCFDAFDDLTIAESG